MFCNEGWGESVHMKASTEAVVGMYAVAANVPRVDGVTDGGWWDAEACGFERVRVLVIAVRERRLEFWTAAKSLEVTNGSRYTGLEIVGHVDDPKNSLSASGFCLTALGASFLGTGWVLRDRVIAEGASIDTIASLWNSESDPVSSRARRRGFECSNLTCGFVRLLNSVRKPLRGLSESLTIGRGAVAFSGDAITKASVSYSCSVSSIGGSNSFPAGILFSPMCMSSGSGALICL